MHDANIRPTLAGLAIASQLDRWHCCGSMHESGDHTVSKED